MFKKIDLKFNLSASPFENLRYRDRTVLILARDQMGKYLMATKKFYPNGIYRLLGGGVDDNEDILSAAQRELAEETGIRPHLDQFVPLNEIFIEGTHNGDIHTLIVFVYFVQLDKDDAVAGDDVADIARMTKDEYDKNTDKLLNLPLDLYQENSGGEKYSWGDYGKVYGFIQARAMEEIEKRGL